MTSKIKAFTIYVGEHEFLAREGGYWMADAVRQRVAEREPELGGALRFDPEAGGVDIAALSRPALERAIEICVDEGLFEPKVLDRLHPDVVVEEWNWSADPEIFDDGAQPFSPDSVTDTTFIALFTVSSYPEGQAPTRDAEEMAGLTRKVVAEQHWPDLVTVRTAHDMFVFVEAETIERLDQVARLVGLPGIESGAEETFERIRSTPPDVPTPLADSPWTVTPNHVGPTEWEARGVLSEVPGYEGRETTTETLRWLYDRLDVVEPGQARVDIGAYGREILIYGSTARDVQWALDALNLRRSCGME